MVYSTYKKYLQGTLFEIELRLFFPYILVLFNNETTIKVAIQCQKTMLYLVSSWIIRKYFFYREPLKSQIHKNLEGY